MYKPGKAQCLASLLLLSFLWGGAGPAQAQPSAGLKDPTAPPRIASGQVAAPQPVASLNLSSVLIGPGRRFAVINGQVVGEGDTFGAVRVVKISKGAVVVRTAGQSSRLTLSEAPDVRHKSNSR